MTSLGSGIGELPVLAFKAALEVDWSSLLDDVGYQPPPPSLVWNRELVDAMTAVLDGEAEADIADARAQLHELGRTLVELSRLGPPDEGRLRRAMRKGVRVAASLLVLAGVVAAIQVAPAIAPFAGAVALAERVIGRERAKKLVDDVLVSGARWLVSKAF